MNIRHFLEKDREDIQRVCLETCNDPYLCENTDVLYTKFANYYMDYESDNIFVVVDDNDKCQGYILCSSDCKKYVDVWNETYLDKLNVKGAFLQKFYQNVLIFEFKQMSKLGYTSHMHIDISPSFQRKGAGSKLLNALINHLKEKGITGLYLDCSTSNQIGNDFYQKNGFRIHHKIPTCNIYVMDLQNK